MAVLQIIDVDWRDRKLIWNLYNQQLAYVRIGGCLSSAYIKAGSNARVFAVFKLL